MGTYVRDRLPGTANYFESEGMALTGRGKWRTTRCEFHGGSDSMRVNTESGGWVCMSCLEHGRDVLAYHMRIHSMGFVEAARALGAYLDDGKPHRGRTVSTTLPPREAMEAIVHYILTVTLVISGIRRGLIPTDADWTSFLDCAGRIEALVMEYRA